MLTLTLSYKKANKCASSQEQKPTTADKYTPILSYTINPSMKVSYNKQQQANKTER
jgi:hypothetical protein